LAQTTPTRAILPQLRHHVASLAHAHGIEVEVAAVRRARAYRGQPSRGRAPRIRIPEIRSQITYFTALHELGHLVSPGNRSLRQLEAEADAWRFALDHALVRPSPATAARLHAYLLSYLRRAEQRRALGHRTAASIPAAGSPYWAMLATLEAAAEP
jgi:hypothetical protein